MSRSSLQHRLKLLYILHLSELTAVEANSRLDYDTLRDNAGKRVAGCFLDCFIKLLTMVYFISLKLFITLVVQAQL